MNVKEQAEKIIADVAQQFTDTNYSVSPIIDKQYNFELSISKGKSKIKLLVYFGKKGIKKILQGNSSSELYKNVNSIINENSELEFGENKIDEPDDYIGTDESGKGDIFGPLVTAAVYLNKTTSAVLNEYGIRDSKTVSDNQIAGLAKIIKNTVGENFEIIVINPAKYNQLYSKFKNLNDLLAWSHLKAIENLSERSKCNEVIIDQFSSKVSEMNKKLFSSKIKVLQTPKAERFTAVAAASILARDKFNNWFKFNPAKELKLKKGASTTVQTQALNIRKLYGEQKINEIAKLNFKTFRQ
jgi:ribonuclease HIII